MNFLDKVKNGLDEAVENGQKMREMIDKEKDRFRNYDDRRLLEAYKEAGGNRVRKAAVAELIKERGLL